MIVYSRHRLVLAHSAAAYRLWFWIDSMISGWEKKFLSGSHAPATSIREAIGRNHTAIERMPLKKVSIAVQNVQKRREIGANISTQWHPRLKWDDANLKKVIRWLLMRLLMLSDMMNDKFTTSISTSNKVLPREYLDYVPQLPSRWHSVLPDGWKWISPKSSEKKPKSAIFSYKIPKLISIRKWKLYIIFIDSKNIWVF